MMQMPSAVAQLSVADLSQLLQNGKRVLLVDVREENEVAFGTLPGSVLFPLSDLPQRMEELKTLAAETYDACVLYCRVGGRSEWARQYLEAQGVGNFFNLDGGFNAWATEIDTSLSPY